MLLLVFVAGALAQRPRPPGPPGPRPTRPNFAKCLHVCDKFEDNADKSPVVCEFQGDDGEYICARPSGFNKCENPKATFCQNGDGKPTRPPQQDPQLSDVIGKSPELSTFYTLLKSSHLDFTFKAPAAFTVLAPTNGAFAKIPKATLESIVGNKTKLFLVLREHISKGVEGVKSTDLVDGLKLNMLNEQEVMFMQKGTTWTVGNADMTSVAQIVKADIAGYSGFATALSYMHEIDTVLLPDFDAPSKEGQVCKPKPNEQCRKFPTDHCPAECKDDDGNECSPSKLTVSHQGRCCPEPCFVQRYKGGTGDKCRCAGGGPTRPGPTNEPTLPPTNAPCPASCQAPLEAKIDAGFTLLQVLSFAFRGGSSSPCGTSPCDATGLLNDVQTRQVECKGNMVFACGDGCLPSCNDPNPTKCIADPKQCTAGCYCPNNAPVFDDAEAQCVPDSKCPNDVECDATLAADFLDSGNRQQDCSAHNSVDQYCKTTCQNNGCVPTQKFEDIAKVMSFCATLTQDNCGQGKYAGYCQYAQGGTGPVFYCGASDDGELGWSVKDAGSCSTGGGSVDETCATLAETNCLVEGECDLSKGSPDQKCFGIVKQAFQDCGKTCTFTGTDDPECANCLTKSLLVSNTINPDEPDIIACCGCMDDVFKAQKIKGFTVDDLNRLLLEPCAEK